jgi:hypothetical protein
LFGVERVWAMSSRKIAIEGVSLGRRRTIVHSCGNPSISHLLAVFASKIITTAAIVRVSEIFCFCINNLLEVRIQLLDDNDIGG